MSRAVAVGIDISCLVFFNYSASVSKVTELFDEKSLRSGFVMVSNCSSTIILVFRRDFPGSTYSRLIPSLRADCTVLPIENNCIRSVTSTPSSADSHKFVDTLNC